MNDDNHNVSINLDDRLPSVPAVVYGNAEESLPIK